jgi:uncharacterized protein (TIGR00661 family)
MNSLAFLDKYQSKKILVAPLNWGLGHATRCMPIIRYLRKSNEVLLGSDGESLRLLQNEFPDLATIELPAYDINYSGSGNFMWDMFKQTPKITIAISKEMAHVEEIVKEKSLDLIISDHRLGCYSELCKSMIIAHQIQIKGNIGIAGMLGRSMNKFFINRFDECWIPDYKSEALCLAGELSRPDGLKCYRFMGPLSRLNLKQKNTQYDIAIILSGPESARSLTESKLEKALAPLGLSIILVQGTERKKVDHSNFTKVMTLCTTDEINQIINQSKIVISRSGYSTIMDLEATEKKAILIPTPGQTEQEYLAKHLSNRDNYRFLSEGDISTEKLITLISPWLYGSATS